MHYGMHWKTLKFDYVMRLISQIVKSTAFEKRKKRMVNPVLDDKILIFFMFCPVCLFKTPFVCHKLCLLKTVTLTINFEW